MKEPERRLRPDLLGEPDEPADIMEGGEEPAGDNPDVLRSGDSPERDDVLERGREPDTANPDVLDSRHR